MSPEAGADDEVLGAEVVQLGAEHMMEIVPPVELMEGILTVAVLPAIFTYLPA